LDKGISQDGRTIGIKLKIKITICILLAIILAATGIFVYCTTGNKSDTDEGNTIRKTIEKSLRIQYGWESKGKIKEISTKEFQKNLNEQTFYHNSMFYRVDKDFMENVKTIDDNEITITVPVYTPDFSISAIWSDDTRPVYRTNVDLPVYFLIKTNDGRYLITDLQCGVY